MTLFTGSLQRASVSALLMRKRYYKVFCTDTILDAVMFSNHQNYTAVTPQPDGVCVCVWSLTWCEECDGAASSPGSGQFAVQAVSECDLTQCVERRVADAHHGQVLLVDVY